MKLNLSIERSQIMVAALTLFGSFGCQVPPQVERDIQRIRDESVACAIEKLNTAGANAACEAAKCATQAASAAVIRIQNTPVGGGVSGFVTQAAKDAAIVAAQAALAAAQAAQEAACNNVPGQRPVCTNLQQQVTDLQNLIAQKERELQEFVDSHSDWYNCIGWSQDELNAEIAKRNKEIRQLREQLQIIRRLLDDCLRRQNEFDHPKPNGSGNGSWTPVQIVVPNVRVSKPIYEHRVPNPNPACGGSSGSSMQDLEVNALPSPAPGCNCSAMQAMANPPYFNAANLKALLKWSKPKPLYSTERN